MKSILPVHSRGYITRKVAQFSKRCSAISLVSFGLLAGTSIHSQTVNHPPTASFLPDQRSSSGMFSKKYFKISDKETPLNQLSVNVVSTNSDFTNPIGITKGVCSGADRDQGCPVDGGYYIDFPGQAPAIADPSATVKVIVTDTGGLSATSSFCLRRDSVMNPPVISGIPTEEIQSGESFKYGPIWFVVGDLNSSGEDDTLDALGHSNITFEKSSDNLFLVPLENITEPEQIGGNGARGWSFSVTPRSNVTGRAVITITAVDPDMNKTSTSFVLDVLANNTPPSFIAPPVSQNPHPTWLEQDIAQSGSATYKFKVTDAETQLNKLWVTAVSRMQTWSLIPQPT